MKIIEKIAKLLEVKSIISITAVVVFAILAIRGELTVENVMVLLTMVFQSFFSYQSNKRDGEKQ